MVLAILASLSEVPLSVTAPPTRPRELDEIEQIEALIEEARRRARRRRWRNGSIAVVLATVAAYLVLSADGGGKSGPDQGGSPAEPPRGSAAGLDRSALAAGRLTLIGLPLDEDRANPAVHGWYQMSVLDARGRLRPFLRCPDDHSYCGLIEGVDWSPDGRHLAFTVGAHALLNPFMGLRLLDARTGVDQHVIDSKVCGLIQRFDLAWSPDGSRLAYVCERPSGGGNALVVFEPGRGVRELPTETTGRISSPTWSPDGGVIAFAVKVAGTPPAIESMRLDGSARSVLARDATAPDWSPDGTAIAYRAGCGGIKLMTPNGREVTPVRGPFPCRSIGVAGTPIWSPEGTELAISNRSGLYLVERNGSRLRRLTEHSSIGPHGGRPAWRPRG
jgi:hypothetical protein